MSIVKLAVLTPERIALPCSSFFRMSCSNNETYQVRILLPIASDYLKKYSLESRTDCRMITRCYRDTWLPLRSNMLHQLDGPSNSGVEALNVHG